MIGIEIRQQLHQYIDAADDNSIEAMYTLLQGNMQQSRFTDDELKMFYDRRAAYLEGNKRGYSVEEAHQLIRQGRNAR